MNHGTPFPRPRAGIPRRRLLRALAPAVLLLSLVPGANLHGASASAAGLKWTQPGKIRRFRGVDRVVVRDFEDRVSEKYLVSPAERRERKRWEMKKARTEVPDALAGALRKTGAFETVERSGNPDVRTLIVEGALHRYDEGDSMARLATRSNAGNPQFEMRLEFKDAEGIVLGSLIAENAPAGVGRGPQPSDSLAGAIERVVAFAAATIAKGLE